MAIARGHHEYLEAQLAALPHLPAVERLTPRVIRILGGNPSKYHLQGTNTYLLGTGRERLLIDTGQGIPIWIETLSEVLKQENAVVTQALLTHWHLDHVTGSRDLRKVSPSTKYYKNSPDDGQEEIQDGQVFTVEGATVRALHTPGHAFDHMCFLFKEEDAIFTGDNVLGHGTTVFSDLGAYMESLQRMLDQGMVGVAYPGHGAVIADAKRKISEYIRHRMRREEQIVKVMEEWKEDKKMRAVGGDLGLTALDIVNVIYTSVGPELRLAAAKGAVQVLEKLEGEGKVKKEDCGGQRKWFLADRPSL
ncbi:Metallo-hydrolase/oxidoreductase [Choiromyces venosus 120613-1]|uniref:Metallo-hydrolase/oxidoreductase n=1 Tax=Choiromyces venosus 120613-1 TaxID=1336337 RepID=A0A3N4JKZ3_9PEZI|nr:Metallo-hydrolase/oxidoreductase [Choiromyces venosus 120613-1]